MAKTTGLDIDFLFLGKFDKIIKRKGRTSILPVKMMKENKFKLLFCLALCLFLALNFVSCGSKGGEEKKYPLEETAGKEKEEEEEEEEETEQEESSGQISSELLKLEPNELGEVMVLMYHEIGYPEGEWKRTPDNFRRDLETLYEWGYRAVSLTDLVRGSFDIPPGTSPVVLTFDDGNKGNFNYLEINGELKIDPDCAVAIMEAFHQKNPDFGLEATFFIYYPNPFRQTAHIKQKINYLVEKGFEIGNHSFSHANLANLAPGEIQRELSLHLKATREYLPGYQVNALALPYGAYPKEPELAIRGLSENIAYEHESVLLVGANPSLSPFHKEFNPYRLPRIRASEINTAGVGLYDWLEIFKKNPRRRYISSGNLNYITVPESLVELLDENKIKDRKIRCYVREPL